MHAPTALNPQKKPIHPEPRPATHRCRLALRLCQPGRQPPRLLVRRQQLGRKLAGLTPRGRRLARGRAEALRQRLRVWRSQG